MLEKKKIFHGGFFDKIILLFTLDRNNTWIVHLPAV